MHKTLGKTAYLGDEYSYSRIAAEILSAGELVPFDAMYKAIAAVGNTCDHAVLPVENNVEGAVNEVYDALWDSGLYIVSQTVVPVRHKLIAESPMPIENAECIVSHPQALGQCRRFIDALGVKTIPAPSTSAALLAVKGGTLAIASRPKPGQTAIAEGIQDCPNNATRFALLSQEPNEAGSLASIAFDIGDGPGALFGILKFVHDREVNMTRIVSRPCRNGDGKYRFFIDFDFTDNEDRFAPLLTEIENAVADYRYFGRYCELRIKN